MLLVKETMLLCGQLYFFIVNLNKNIFEKNGTCLGLEQFYLNIRLIIGVMKTCV